MFLSSHQPFLPHKFSVLSSSMISDPWEEGCEKKSHLRHRRTGGAAGQRINRRRNLGARGEISMKKEERMRKETRPGQKAR